MARFEINKIKVDITQWCDFVRGVADPNAQQRMEEMLATGPARARRDVELLSLVVDVARADAALEIPEYALRGAMAIGSLRRPRQAASLVESIVSSVLHYIPFSLSFDSLLQPAQVGTRDIQSANRQLIFRAEDFTVDVQLEHETEPPSTVVVGQLLRGDGEIRPVPEIPIYVVAGDQIVGRSLTGEFGEFQAEGLPREALNLCLLVGREECIEVPIELDAAVATTR